MQQLDLFGSEPVQPLPVVSVAGTMSQPLTVCYGLGVNSTALLVGLEQRGIRPDLITFADTGGEKPETYAYLEIIQTWLIEMDFPEIHVVRRNAYPEDCNAKGATTLEEYCLRTGALPSIAYGWKTCSDQWKGRAQEAFVASWPDAVETWKHEEKVCQARGYHADEPHRAKHSDSKKFHFWYPLIEWDWGQDDCINAIKASGLPVPPKSACFF